MVIEAPCAGYVVEPDLNLQEVGRCIDDILVMRFGGRKIVLRAVSSSEHNMSREELLKQIERLGTDR